MTKSKYSKNNALMILTISMFFIIGVNIALKVSNFSWPLLDFIIIILGIFWAMLVFYIITLYRFKNPTPLIALGVLTFILAVASFLINFFITPNPILERQIFSGVIPFVVGMIIGNIFTIAIGICSLRFCK